MMNSPKKNWQKIREIVQEALEDGIEECADLLPLIDEQIDSAEATPDERPMSWNEKHYSDMCDPAFMADYYGTYDGPELSGDPRYGDDWE